eukprot:g4284.t1
MEGIAQLETVCYIRIRAHRAASNDRSGKMCRLRILRARLARLQQKLESQKNDLEKTSDRIKCGKLSGLELTEKSRTVEEEMRGRLKVLTATLKFPGINISVVDSKRKQELLLFTLIGSTFGYSNYRNRQTDFSIVVKEAQVDHMSPSTRFKTIIKMHHRERKKSGGTCDGIQPIFQLSAIKQAVEGVDHWDYLSVLLQEIDVQCDLSMLFECLDWFMDIKPALMDHKVSKIKVHSSGEKKNIDRSEKLFNDADSESQWKQNKLILLDALWANRQQKGSTFMGSKKVQRMYFRVFQLQPIRLNMTFKVSGSELTNRMTGAAPAPVRLAIDTLVNMIGNIDNSPVRLDAFFVEFLLEDQEVLMATISQFYKTKLLSNWKHLVGSADILGNPVGLASNMGTGVKDFFYEPANGLMSSPEDFAIGLKTGTFSLLTKVTGGVFNSGSKIVGSVNSGVARLAMDESYMKEREKRKNTSRPAHVGDGIADGVESLFKGVTGK